MGDSVNQFESSDSPMVLLRRLHRWRMAFFGLVILLAGVLSGAAVTLLVVGHGARQVSAPPLPVVRELIARIGPRLRLTEEQSRQIEPVLLKHMQRLDEIGEDGRAAIVEELKIMNDELAGVLTDDQMRQWQRLMEGLPSQIRHAPGGFGPGPGGGAPGRGFGGGRMSGPRRDGQGPLRTSPGRPAAPEANTPPPP